MINRSLRRRNKWSMNRCDDKQLTMIIVNANDRVNSSDGGESSSPMNVDYSSRACKRCCLSIRLTSSAANVTSPAATFCHHGRNNKVN